MEISTEMTLQSFQSGERNYMKNSNETCLLSEFIKLHLICIFILDYYDHKGIILRF